MTDATDHVVYYLHARGKVALSDRPKALWHALRAKRACQLQMYKYYFPCKSIVSEGQKHEAIYMYSISIVLILDNISFLHFMNDYKKKNIETGLWVTSVFKRRAISHSTVPLSETFPKKRDWTEFFKHTTFSQPFGWNLNKGKLWDLWHCECGDVTHGLFHVAWLNIKVFKLTLKLVHKSRNLKKKNETNHFCLILNRKEYACF